MGYTRLKVVTILIMIQSLFTLNPSFAEFDAIYKAKKLYLKTETGKIWLLTPEGQNWLESSKRGARWITSSTGEEWLKNAILEHGAENFIKHKYAYVWLRQPQGETWLKTPNGKAWLQNNPNGDADRWLVSHSGKFWLTSLDAQTWLNSNSGRHWLENVNGGGPAWLWSSDADNFKKTSERQAYISERDRKAPLFSRSLLSNPAPDLRAAPATPLFDYPVPKVRTKTNDSYEEAREQMLSRVTRLDRFSPIYESTKQALGFFKDMKALPKNKGELYVNLDYISADPYKKENHAADLSRLFPGPIDAEEWLGIKKTLMEFKGVGELARGLSDVLSRADDDEAPPEIKNKKETIRKRIKRLLKDAEKREADGKSESILDLSLALLGNQGRCIDGLQDGLSQLEKAYFNESTESKTTQIGAFISSVLNNYKIDFIQKHGELNSESSEFQTTVRENLRQQLIFALGLHGEITPVKHPMLGSPGAPELQTKRIMERFLNGETVERFNGEPVKGGPVKFEAYTLDLMVKLLQHSRKNAIGSSHLAKSERNGSIKLTDGLLNVLVQNEDEIAPYYLEIFEEPTKPNPYFIPAAAGEDPGHVRIKDEFWRYFLQKEGYILRK